uniref:Uncharacterized protein n=1 Tax=Arundo donax TaxID=35708 RepID=A0A0A8Y2Z8_ARUDO
MTMIHGNCSQRKHLVKECKSKQSLSRLAGVSPTSARDCLLL